MPRNRKSFLRPKILDALFCWLNLKADNTSTCSSVRSKRQPAIHHAASTMPVPTRTFEKLRFSLDHRVLVLACLLAFGVTGAKIIMAFSNRVYCILYDA